MRLSSTDEFMPDQFGRLLFKVSSVLPDVLIQRANSEGAALKSGARGVAYNADLPSLVEFMNFAIRVR